MPHLSQTHDLSSNNLLYKHIKPAITIANLFELQEIITNRG